jgi:hypothetical protein
MLREMRSALRDVAVALPPPALFEQRGPGFGAVLEKAADAWAAAKHAMASALGRGSGQSSAVEQAGAAGAAGVGGGAAAKLAAACIAAGGTAGVCVQTGLFERAAATHGQAGARGAAAGALERRHAAEAHAPARGAEGSLHAADQLAEGGTAPVARAPGQHRVRAGRPRK